MISLIIPLYNASAYLDKLLKSIQYQEEINFEYYEFIFVDNNSDDDSSNIIHKFIKENCNINVKYVFFDKKSSSYASRNCGVENSRGNILVFIDSDCILTTDYLKNLEYYKESRSSYIIIGKV